MKFRLSDLNADTIKKGFEHIRSTAIPEALSKARSMVTGLDLAYDRFFKENIEADEEALATQRERVFSYCPCISIVVPVYMTPELSYVQCWNRCCIRPMGTGNCVWSMAVRRRENRRFLMRAYQRMANCRCWRRCIVWRRSALSGNIWRMNRESST